MRVPRCAWTVLYSRMVSKSRRFFRPRSICAHVPVDHSENAARGIAVTAADCAGLQRVRVPHPVAAWTSRRLSHGSADPRTCRRRVSYFGVGAGAYVSMTRPMSESAT